MDNLNPDLKISSEELELLRTIALRDEEIEKILIAKDYTLLALVLKTAISSLTYCDKRWFKKEEEYGEYLSIVSDRIDGWINSNINMNKVFIEAILAHEQKIEDLQKEVITLKQLLSKSMQN